MCNVWVFITFFTQTKPYRAFFGVSRCLLVGAAKAAKTRVGSNEYTPGAMRKKKERESDVPTRKK